VERGERREERGEWRVERGECREGALKGRHLIAQSVRAGKLKDK